MIGLHLADWPLLDPSCFDPYCFAFAKSKDTFSIIQNIHFNFSFFIFQVKTNNFKCILLLSQFHIYFPVWLKIKQYFLLLFFILTINCITHPPQKCTDLILLKFVLLVYFTTKIIFRFLLFGSLMPYSTISTHYLFIP